MAADVPRVVVLGATGQVGREIVPLLQRIGSVVALGRSDADLARPGRLRDAVLRQRPDVIVNCAAYTRVDDAEREPGLAETVNATAPGILAKAAKETDALMVHFSTDYVFDGAKAGAYTETDAPAPLSVYGRTKLAGDIAVEESCRRHLILRTSWVYAPHGANFVRTMLRLGTERRQLRVVDDQHGAPTSAALIARVTVALLERAISPGFDGWGTYNLAASGETTWHEYARFIVSEARARGADLQLAAEDILPIPTTEYPTPARRPLNSRLDTSKLRAVLGTAIPDWREGVRDALDRLLVSVST